MLLFLVFLLNTSTAEETLLSKNQAIIVILAAFCFSIYITIHSSWIIPRTHFLYHTFNEFSTRSLAIFLTFYLGQVLLKTKIYHDQIGTNLKDIWVILAFGLACISVFASIKLTGAVKNNIDEHGCDRGDKIPVVKQYKCLNKEISKISTQLNLFTSINLGLLVLAGGLAGYLLANTKLTKPPINNPECSTPTPTPIPTPILSKSTSKSPVKKNSDVNKMSNANSNTILDNNTPINSSNISSANTQTIQNLNTSNSSINAAEK